MACFKCKKQGHYANACEEDVDNKDGNTTKKASNKKGSKFMNQVQYEKTKVDGNEDDTSDEEAESCDDDNKFAFLQHDVTCTIQDKVAIPKMWILLDSKSTVDVFSNP